MTIDSSIVDLDWTPPRVVDLNVFQKGDAFLCMNSAVPSWLVTTQLGSSLLTLVDGSRRIGQIADDFRQHGVAADTDLLIEFFRQAVDSGLFLKPPRPRDDDTGDQTVWLSRRITAVHLHLTNQCNLSCSYCYRSSHPNIPLRTGAEQFIRILGEIKALAAPGCEITFAGGEPLVYPHFARIAEVSSKLGFRNFILTNGILLRRNDGEFYRRFVDNLRVSLDGGDELTHSATRGKGHFEKVISNIHWLVEQGLTPSVQMTLTRKNIASAKELKSRLPKNVALRYTPMFPMGRGDKERQAVSPDDFITPAEFYDFRVSYEGGGMAGTERTPMMRSTGCHAGRSNISIDDNGDVYPCHLFHYERFSMGNCLETSLEDILFGAKMKSYVASMHVDANNPECAKCAIRYLCAGGCKANALHGRGDYRARDSLCEYLRKDTIRDLFAAYEL